MVSWSLVTSRSLQVQFKECFKFNSLRRYHQPSFVLLNQFSVQSKCCISECFTTSEYTHFPCRQFSQQNQFKTSSTGGRGGKGYRKMKLLAIGFGLGAIVGLGYMYKSFQYKQNPVKNISSKNDFLLLEPPPIEFIAKKIKGKNNGVLEHITLFQYEPCPFCKKVRAFLDYSGLSYDVVEVNPVTKKQLLWSAYKKVPVVIIKLKEGYQQLNDSTVIISSLASYLADPQQNLTKIVEYYPEVGYQESNGKIGSEVMNRYFLMFGEKEPKGQSMESIAEERRWRQWSDEVLMHTLSPNIYRTWEEALEAFNMFSKNGDWERIFSTWERQVVIYVGAAVMYLIGKRLKKRHNLLDDTRQSLYNEVDHFLKNIHLKGTPFIGGEKPNLADLAVFGCISSIDGTRTFKDLVDHTNLLPWYEAMCSIIESHRGKISLDVANN